MGHTEGNTERLHLELHVADEWLDQAVAAVRAMLDHWQEAHPDEPAGPLVVGHFAAQWEAAGMRDVMERTGPLLLAAAAYRIASSGIPTVGAG